MADTSIFTRLKRLFSSDVIIRNVGDNELKVVDVNSIQKSGKVETNSLLDRFDRIYSTSPTSLYGHQSSLNYQILRTQLYSEYDVMDSDAIIASALDIIADECTLKNEMGEVLQIKSSNETIQKILYNLFYDVLNVEFNLWTWIRNMCKYGDFFLKLEIADKFGVYNVIPYSAYHIERQEGYDKENPSNVRFRFDPDGLGAGTYGQYNVPGREDGRSIIFDNYEVAHFRLLTDINFLPYGRSYIEPGRKLWKQYALMEDAMLIHRIVRAPERRIFYLNVGGIPPNEIDNFMEKTVSKMKRTPYIDPQTGEYNLKYNMQNMLEDYYIPVRGNDNSTKIDTAKGLEYEGIKDVEYLRDKLFAALKVPKAFMGYEKDLTGKATLAAEDIRFARTIDRLQRIILSELYKIALVHLYTQGYKDSELTNFELMMTTPSIIYDQERIALMKEKVSLAKDAVDSKLLPSDWVYKNVFHFSEDEFDDYRDLVREDAKRDFRLEQMKNEGNDPTESGKSYGTPHDLASLYGTGRYQENPANVPPGYNEDAKLGRPVEKSSFINTQKDPLGRDRLGRKANKIDDSEENQIRENHDSKKEFMKNKKLLESLENKILASGINKIEMLDEKNIKE
jgi:hypothetical protein